LQALLPVDTTVMRGKLDNGLTYYIKYNSKPEKRLELRLVVNAGSVLEDDDQQGLAHFLEHMAFNGTRHFAKQELINYIQSIGMRFGADLNAYTSFDETVYMLQIPTDNDSLLEKGFMILSDWAHQIALESEEIDKERGVIREEWRLSRGAAARIEDRQLPLIYFGSQYAQRLPIGQMAVIDTFRHERLRQFYQDWYRPDLMAVVVVGDAEPWRVQQLISRYLGALPVKPALPVRITYAIPDHQETLFSIETDPELTTTSIDVLYKFDAKPVKTVGDYREHLVETLYNTMLNNRLGELAREADPPYLRAYSRRGRLSRLKEYYLIGAVTHENQAERALETLLTEVQRVRLYGFTLTELQRAKDNLLQAMEIAYRERGKTESANYANEYIRNFLLEEPIPGIQQEYALCQQLLPTISLSEVNYVSQRWMLDHNRVVLYAAPQKQTTRVPTPAGLLAVMQRVLDKEILAYVDKVPNQPLVKKISRKGHIMERHRYPELGVSEYVLNNGVKVVLKPTEFKNDEILMAAFSPGGHSLVTDSLFIPAVTATPLIAASGVGEFGVVELEKKLAGKVVKVRCAINDITESLSGSATPRDFETMLQLIYLYFTTPRKDSIAFVSYVKKLRSALENRAADPFAVFSDSLRATVTQNHFRARPLNLKMIPALNLEKSFQVFKERFADASDFTFFFVGNLDTLRAPQLIARYLGALPNLKRQERWVDVGIYPPQGVINKAIQKGIEPQSYVELRFTGDFEWSRQNRYALAALAELLRLRLREQVREEKGGTYGVRVSQSNQQYPHPEYSLNISWGCAPERVEELIRVVMTEVEKLHTELATEDEIRKIKETHLRTYETNLKENRYWLDILNFYYFNGEDPRLILQYPELVRTLSAEQLRATARRYLKPDNYVQVVLFPEK
jgi:zinc protease